MIETVEELVKLLLKMPQQAKPYIQLTDEEDIPITGVIYDEESEEVVIETI
jgi:hypothetical protein